MLDNDSYKYPEPNLTKPISHNSENPIALPSIFFVSPKETP